MKDLSLSYPSVQFSGSIILKRWTQLFTGPLLVVRYLSDRRVDMTEAEIACVEELAEEYRARLQDLSWFRIPLIRSTPP